MTSRDAEISQFDGNQSVSNLVVRPQSSAGEPAPTPETVRSNVLVESTDDGITLRELWKSLLRRRKLAAITAGVVFVLTLANAVQHRVRNPLFAGGFTLLISDPLGDERGDPRNCWEIRTTGTQHHEH